MARRILAAATTLLLAACGEESSTGVREGDAEATSSFAKAQREIADVFGLPTSFENVLGMRFVLVPPGRFQMGSAPSEPRRGDDEIRHEVEIIGPYYIQVDDEGGWTSTPAGAAAAQGVSHEVATAIAAYVSDQDPKWKFRLPTEAEWEYAAREADALGLRGTTGGAWEWCADWYAGYPDWLMQNPAGPQTGEERSLRGGGPRIAERRHAPPGRARADAGIRLMAPLPYATADIGACTLTFRSIDTNGEGHEVAEHPGLEVRLISVFDRLSSRQMGLELPWTVIAAHRTPFAWHLPPGRYYAQAQEPGTDQWRGIEKKIYLDVGTPTPVQVVNLPTPKKGGVLTKPR